MMLDALDATFAALADPTRRAILARLADGPATVGEIAAPLPISLPAVSRHLDVLERAGLIARGRRAQWRPCRIKAAPLREAGQWIDRYRAFWEGGFDRMADVLATLDPDTKETDDDSTTG
jgi:DNA-binding transcriptional ArsR family regulator